MAIHDGNFVKVGDIYVPNSYVNSAHLSYIGDSWFDQNPLNTRGFNFGYALHRDESTLIPRFPRKGSGVDDFASAQIVDGNVANVGVSPVIHPQISSMLGSHLIKALTATIELTGKKTPSRKARDAIARFNDSPLGVTDAIQHLVYGLHVYNRGAPIATIPIHMPFDKWQDYGLTAIPLDRDRDTPKKYRLDVDWATIGTVIPYLPSVFDLEPTGNTQYPYWLRVERDRNDYVWVLLHQSHIKPLVLRKSSKPGIGTSTVWTLLGLLAKHILVEDYRLEKTLNAAGDGIVGISGIQQTADTIKKKIEGTAEDSKKMGNILSKGTTFITSPMNDIKIVYMSLRQDDGVPFDQWRMYMEDVITHAFGDPLSALVTRGGVGFGSQAETTADQSSDSGVGALLHFVATALGNVYHRVSVAIKMPNDRAQRLNISTFKEFAEGVSSLNATVAPAEGDNGASHDPILSREEIRRVIHRDIFAIPDTGQQAGSTSPNANTDPTDPIMNAPLSPLVDVRSLLAQYRYQFEPIEPDGADDPLPEVTPAPDSIADQGFDEEFPDYAGLLQADPVDEAPDDEDDHTHWLWVVAFLYFLRPTERVDAEHPHRVPDSELLTVRDALPDNRQAETSTLANLIATGQINLQEHNRRLKAIVQQTDVHEYVMRRGGYAAMTPADWTELTTLIQRHYEEIDALSQQIGDGNYSEAQIAQYSGNIVKGSREAYERANASANGVSLPAYPADGSTVCSKGDVCTWRLVQLPGDGNVDAYWVLHPADHCPTCLERSALWNPLEIRGGEYTTHVPTA